MRQVGNRAGLETVGESSSDEPNSLVTSLSGCAYLLVILLVTTGMLIVNAIVCLSIHSAYMTFGPPRIVEDPTISPFFVVPILLTIVQWNLLDRLNRIFRGQ
jgi:hypothetical protein